jgi:hypothetical protein
LAVQAGESKCCGGVLGAGAVCHVGEVAVWELHAPHVGPFAIGHDASEFVAIELENVAVPSDAIAADKRAILLIAAELG